MNNKVKEEMNKIEIPKELSYRSKLGVSKAKKEMKNGRKRYSAKGIGIAVALVVSIGAYTLFNNNLIPNDETNSQNTPVVMEDGGVKIPPLQLPEGNENASMIGLIVYNGKIYTQTDAEIDTENAKAIMGKKLGTTKGTIDEWSKQEAYSEELASTIGIVDVYSVKGYDKDFRIMAYKEQEGEIYAEFYENLNGITIKNGKDIFGKLNILGNVSTAQWRTFSDWDNSVENYHPIKDMEVVSNFIQELNKVKPLPRKENSDPIGNSRNNEDFKKLIFLLNDGSKVSLTLLKEGYIYYGFMGVYFKMDEEAFSEMWKQIQ